MSANLSKGELRAIALAKRDALSDKQREAAAKALAKRGLPIEITAGMVISAYSPIRNEIDPAPLMEKLARQGARLALPTINARGKALVFRSYAVGDRLMLSSLGIPEPSPAAAEVVPDIMLVPLPPSTRSATASATAQDITTTPSRICAKPGISSASGLPLPCRKSRPSRPCRTTYRWIMC